MGVLLRQGELARHGSFRTFLFASGGVKSALDWNSSPPTLVHQAIDCHGAQEQIDIVNVK